MSENILTEQDQADLETGQDYTVSRMLHGRMLHGSEPA